ncbi:MAG: xanthine dehydrogenase family protein subunit M [Deltaproteobacteria bacterium]|nr:xanthine dehydrogenase family protein subunit M [Deltaproteobacteria bacterium]
MLRALRMSVPTTAPEAAGELARLGENAKIYAGGAELVLLLRRGLIDADHLVNIKHIPSLDSISWEGGIMRIGATVTHHRLETEALVRAHLPMFVQAESQVANIRVRNQGTIGGNLCFNDPHSDPGVALLVYEAGVLVVGRNGQRQMRLQDFLTGMYETALEPDELLVEIQVPPLPAGWGGAYLRVHRLQRPTLGVAAGAKMQDGRLEDVRLALGCVGPTPKRLEELEAKIRGAKLDEAERIIGESKTYLTQSLQPVGDILGSADYKLHISCVLLGRALEQAANGGVKAE